VLSCWVQMLRWANRLSGVRWRRWRAVYSLSPLIVLRA